MTCAAPLSTGTMPKSKVGAFENIESKGGSCNKGRRRLPWLSQRCKQKRLWAPVAVHKRV